MRRSRVSPQQFDHCADGDRCLELQTTLNHCRCVDVTRVSKIIKIKRLAFLAINMRISTQKVLCNAFHASKT